MSLTFIDRDHGQAFAEFSELRRTYRGPGHERMDALFLAVFGIAFYRAWLDWQRRHIG